MIKNDQTYKKHVETLCDMQKETATMYMHSNRVGSIVTTVLAVISVLFLPVLGSMGVYWWGIVIAAVLAALFILFAVVYFKRSSRYRKILAFFAIARAGRSEKTEILCESVTPILIDTTPTSTRWHRHEPSHVIAVSLKSAEGKAYFYVIPSPLPYSTDTVDTIRVELERQRLLLTCYAETDLVQFIDGVSPTD